ncbi:MAG TPA: hypothetical protein VMW58_04445 [Anaerolineae bacterium]|nr:hypothetical protein [Anaerolineae bacterium]
MAAKVAGLTAVVNALLLLLVALAQLLSGDMVLSVVGLVNFGVALFYSAVAYGLFACKSWSYREGLRLGIANLGWVLFQMTIGQGLLSEFGMDTYLLQDLTLPILFLVGDAAMVVAIFAGRGALVYTSSADGVYGEGVEPPILSHLLEDAGSHGEISDSERDALLLVRREFVTSLAEKRGLLVDLEEVVGRKRVDIKAASIGTLIPGVEAGTETYYVFFATATTRTVESYRRLGGGSKTCCVIALDATEEALEQAIQESKGARRLWEGTPHFSLYDLRRACRAATGKGTDEFGGFMMVHYGVAMPDWKPMAKKQEHMEFRLDISERCLPSDVFTARDWFATWLTQGRGWKISVEEVPGSNRASVKYGRISWVFTDMASEELADTLCAQTGFGGIINIVARDATAEAVAFALTNQGIVLYALNERKKYGKTASVLGPAVEFDRFAKEVLGAHFEWTRRLSNSS